MIALPSSLRAAVLWSTLALVSVGSVAFAATRLPPEDPPSTPPPPPHPPPPPPPAAPTVTLATLANAMTIKSRSVTALVEARAALNLTAPVRISVKFGNAGNTVTADYDNTNGNHFLSNLPVFSGAVRSEKIQVTLVETIPGGQSFTFNFTRQIVPLYEVRTSNLVFTPLEDGDPFGDHVECAIDWSEPDGATQHHSVTLPVGRSHIFTEFARTFPAVSAAAGLTLPRFDWYELDLGPAFIPPVLEPGVSSVIIGPSYVTHVDRVIRDLDDDVPARFQYTIMVTLRTYQPWEL